MCSSQSTRSTIDISRILGVSIHHKLPRTVSNKIELHNTRPEQNRTKETLPNGIKPNRTAQYPTRTKQDSTKTGPKQLPRTESNQNRTAQYLNRRQTVNINQTNLFPPNWIKQYQTAQYPASTKRRAQNRPESKSIELTCLSPSTRSTIGRSRILGVPSITNSPFPAHMTAVKGRMAVPAFPRNKEVGSDTWAQKSTSPAQHMHKHSTGQHTTARETSNTQKRRIRAVYGGSEISIRSS